MRVLGIAVRVVTDAESRGVSDSLEQNMTFIGLVGMADPPRHGVKSAIERCSRAGVRTVMITGDHPATANQVAHELGLSINGKTVCGEELSRLSAEELSGV